jgi:hypothetical protein
VIARAPEAPASANPWVEPAREVLVQYCGSCHRPGLPTTNSRALGVFNLHEPVWYRTMTDDQLRELRRRAGEMLRAKDDDRDTLVAFVDCELDHVCGPARKKESH